MTTISFLVDLPPLALRRNSETAQRGFRARLVREYQEQVWCAGQRLVQTLEAGGYVQATMTCPPAVPWPRAHLKLTWRHHRVGPDADNALASCKYLIDVLKATGPRPLGIFRDDSPDCLTVEIRTEKVKHKQDEGVLVEVTQA